MYFGSWEALTEIGSGGQGTVYLARRNNNSLAQPNLAESFSQWVHALTASNIEFKRKQAEKIFQLIREISADTVSQHFALKVLHEFVDDPGIRQKALGRLYNEIEILRECAN